jgi:hypothetical protein
MSLVAWGRSVGMAAGILAAALVASASAQTAPEVKLTVETASPRAVEPLTEHSIARDYAAAWKTLDQASQENSPAALDAYFVGDADAVFRRAIAGQQSSGVKVRYLNQIHNVKAVFYAPEGDVIELQDAAEYQLQVVDDGKVIHDEHVVAQYVVLMTPAADRWVVRQLQSIPAM